MTLKEALKIIDEEACLVQQDYRTAAKAIAKKCKELLSKNEALRGQMGLMRDALYNCEEELRRLMDVVGDEDAIIVQEVLSALESAKMEQTTDLRENNL
mgnify:CR=1 FL=1